MLGWYYVVWFMCVDMKVEDVNIGMHDKSI
jgi:hypothetical protein